MELLIICVGASIAFTCVMIGIERLIGIDDESVFKQIK